MNDARRAELEKGYRKGKNHTFGERCQMILLKAENRASLEAAEILGCCEVAVNNWLKRFESEGIKGIETRAGRGRPPILSQQNAEHLKKVEREIKERPTVKIILTRNWLSGRNIVEVEPAKKIYKSIILTDVYNLKMLVVIR